MHIKKRLSSLTKIKDTRGWTAVQDLEILVHDDGSGAALWIWKAGMPRSDAPALAIDFRGPHGQADLFNLMTALQEAYVHYASPEERANDARLRDLAQEQNGRDGELEFEDTGLVSISEDGGAYVQAWSWIYDPEASKEDDDAEGQ